MSAEPPSPPQGPALHDVAVLGLGVMGLATAWRLASAGLSVLGLEQLDLFHDRGSSHGSTRVTRKAYFEHPGYVPLLHQAHEGWRELEAQSGASLIVPCGVLSLGPSDGTLVPGVRQSSREHAIQTIELSGDELRERFPGLDVPASWAAVLEPDAGFLYADRALRALAAAARERGARLLDNTHVESWSVGTDGIVTLETEGGTHRARALVISAGPWAKPAFQALGIELRLVRKLLYWYLPVEPAAAAGLPCLLAETPEGFYYAIPEAQDAPEEGIKVARHDEDDALLARAALASAEEADLEGRADAQDELEAPAVEAFARQLLAPAVAPAGADPVCIDSDVCLYSYSPDGHFLLGRHPAHANVALAAGFSGHGFKFAPVIGDVMARLVAGEELPPEAEFLNLRRLAR